jgi:hypothetical protein
LIFLSRWRSACWCAQRYCPRGEALPAELQAKVKANPKACTHFFGGEMGCTMGDGCRFLHAL